MHSRSRISIFASVLCTILILTAAFALGATYHLFSKKIVDLSPLEQYNPGKPTIILDDEGHEWARFAFDRREPVPFERLPKVLINAVLAAEDHDFFSHSGISIRGIVRSLVVNLLNGRKVQGASTITQQLVKLLFFDGRKTFERKLKEQFYALLVERQCTKEQILEIYLNHVYLGAGIYGVEAASQRFWNISVSQLSIDQAAMLAGIIRSPSRYCPLTSPINAQRRRNLIIRLMRDYGFISSKEYERAYAKPLILHQPHSKSEFAPHLKEAIRIELEEKVGRKQLYSGGLVVQTTINRQIQEAAQKVFTEHVQRLKQSMHPYIDGALMTLDVQSGEIKAMVGGVDFTNSKFNRALQARRQLGSIIKPFIFAAAVKQGRTFAEMAIDEPMEVLMPNGQLWKPNNASGLFEGPMTLARALATSNNSIAIKTLLEVGCDTAKSLAEKCKIPGLKPYPSLALGCVDVTVNTATAAFNVFANHGVYVAPFHISWIKDQWGKKIYKHQPERYRVLPARVSDQVAKVLGLATDRLRIRLGERGLASDVIGKTGTNNEFRTNFYIGSTPSLTTGIYIGCDDNSPMGKNMFARKTAFPIFFSLHKQIPSAIKNFSFDPGLREQLIDEKTGDFLDDPKDPHACLILVPQ